MQILHWAPNARGRPPVGALIVFVAALSMFVGIVFVFAIDGQVSTIDARVGMWMHLRATPFLTDLMAAVSFLGAPTTLTTIALGGAGLLLFLRKRLESATLSIVVLGGNGLNLCLKHLFQRGRPVFDDPLFSLPTYSFPSGHAMASTVFYGLLAVHASAVARRHRSAYIAVVAATSMVALVCVSRLYLGLHYLSDVMAGISEGIAWLALSFGVLQYMRRDPDSVDRDADR